MGPIMWKKCHGLFCLFRSQGTFLVFTKNCYLTHFFSSVHVRNDPDLSVGVNGQQGGRETPK